MTVLELRDGKVAPVRRSLLAGWTTQGGIDAGGGLIIRRQVGCRWWPEGTDDDPPYDVTLWATYNDDARRYEVDWVHIGRVEAGPTVTSHAFRSIPIAGMLRHLTGRAIIGVAQGPGAVAFRNAPGTPFVMPDDNLTKTLKNRLDDDSYRKVGIVHRVHELVGSRATTEVARHFGVSRTTAYTWTKEVEARGLMEPIWAPNPDDPVARLTQDEIREHLDRIASSEREGTGQ